VVQAAFAQHALTAIHPFADGNGRVARALASVFLYRAARIPLLLYSDQKYEYYDVLEEADAGKPEKLLEFFLFAAVSALSTVEENLRTAAVPRLDDTLEDLRSLFVAQGGLTHQELDAVGGRLFDELVTATQEAWRAIDLPPGIDNGVGLGSGEIYRADGYRQLLAGGGRFLNVTATSPPPAAARVQERFQLLVSTERDDAETFMLVSTESSERLNFGLRDVYPASSAATTQRLESLAIRTAGRLMRDLTQGAALSLQRSGYT
jgi:hypothetical protein